jgi:hypothetical protein
MQTPPGQVPACRKAKPAFTQSASDTSVISVILPMAALDRPPVQPGTSFPPSPHPLISRLCHGACFAAPAGFDDRRTPMLQACGGQLAYAPPLMVDMLVLRKRIETNKKEELNVVKFSNVRRINKKKRVILHFSAVLFLFA